MQYIISVYACKCMCEHDLQMWHQATRLYVQSVCVETKFPLQHLLIVQLKLHLAACRYVDLCFKSLHCLRVSPEREKSV